MEIGKKYDIQIVNVFHAGDGNIHPVMLFDERDPSQTERVLKAGGEILQLVWMPAEVLPESTESVLKK